MNCPCLVTTSGHVLSQIANLPCMLDQHPVNCPAVASELPMSLFCHTASLACFLDHQRVNCACVVTVCGRSKSQTPSLPFIFDQHPVTCVAIASALRTNNVYVISLLGSLSATAGVPLHIAPISSEMTWNICSGFCLSRVTLYRHLLGEICIK